MSEEFSISRLLFLRKITRAISHHLQAQLKEQLNTLAPLLRPRRMLGDYIESGSPEPVVDAEKNFAALAETYARAAGKPLDLPRPLRPPLRPIGLALEVYPWEYTASFNSGGQTKAVTVTSPVRWVLSYSSGLSLSRLRLGIAGREERKQDDVQQFAIRCCLMQAMLQKYAGIVNLLRALRWEVAQDSIAELGGLPLTTLTAPLGTKLPPDNLVVESTEMSGTPYFEEIIDVGCLAQIPDPLAERVKSIVQAAEAGV